jgi:MFS family permease
MPPQEFATGETKDESSRAGVSWAAIFAGAFTMGALGLILGVLGAGVGLSSVSQWLTESSQASRMSAGAVIWLILVQLVASAIGGYLAGRLRTKWVSLHNHEVYFRDTAHGFIAWAVALVISVLLFVSYTTAVATARPAVESAPANYFVDLMFRTDHPAPARNDQPLRTEAALILANALRHPDMSKPDEAYLAKVIIATTGLTQVEAQQRVSEAVAADREAADAARKVVAHSLYWLFVALLIGAFCASYAATIGGRRRDNVPALQ